MLHFVSLISQSGISSNFASIHKLMLTYETLYTKKLILNCTFLVSFEMLPTSTICVIDVYLEPPFQER